MSNANYVSLSLAAVLERSLDATANNIANVSTSGFKASRPLIESLAVPGGDATGAVSFVQDKGRYLDLSQGALTQTESPFDVALSGPGWFSYETQAGQEAYGRDGRLVLSAEGQLTTTSGAALLDAGGGPIILPAEVGTDIVIARDGTITGAGGDVLGQIGTFTIEDPNTLTAIGGGLYVLAGGAEAEAAPVASNAVVQGYLEESNVQATVEVTRMMDIQRAYERAVRVIDQTDQLTRTAIQTISRRV